KIKMGYEVLLRQIIKNKEMKKMIYRVYHSEFVLKFKNDASKYLNAEEIGINILLFYLKK
ncbi:MAG: hypothetical protein ACPL3A_11395, partial [Thermoanaerobacteraceae bacterium]